MSESIKADNVKLAIGTILLVCLFLSFGDAIIKQQSSSFVLWQIFALRSAIVIPVLLCLLRLRFDWQAMRPQSLPWTLLRSLILVLMWVCYFIALPHIEFAVAAAAYYTLPIFITLFAAFFLGEKISVYGWTAVAIGFSGAVLILQPQAEDFNAWTLLPLISALLYAIAMILTRSKCRAERPTVLSLWLNLGFFVTGLVALLLLAWWDPTQAQIEWNPFLFGPWTSMESDEWALMLVLAIAILVGSIGAAIAYQLGDASKIAIFDFSYVGFAALWGYLMFAEVPSALVSAGILMIVAAGMLSSLPRRN